jgi:hypothetical protein
MKTLATEFKVSEDPNLKTSIAGAIVTSLAYQIARRHIADDTNIYTRNSMIVDIEEQNSGDYNRTYLNSDTADIGTEFLLCLIIGRYWLFSEKRKINNDKRGSKYTEYYILTIRME